MDRRGFLKASVGATAVGTFVSRSPAPAAGCAVTKTDAATTPAVLNAYTAEHHRRRLHNIRMCEGGIRKCMRKHLITSYLPGQCVYNLCEYPSPKRWEPGDYDEQELDKLQESGIGLIQLFEWRDQLGLFGGNQFTPHNRAGFRRFCIQGRVYSPSRQDFVVVLSGARMGPGDRDDPVGSYSARNGFVLDLGGRRLLQLRCRVSGHGHPTLAVSRHLAPVRAGRLRLPLLRDSQVCRPSRIAVCHSLVLE